MSFFYTTNTQLQLVTDKMIENCNIFTRRCQDKTPFIVVDVTLCIIDIFTAGPVLYRCIHQQGMIVIATVFIIPSK